MSAICDTCGKSAAAEAIAAQQKAMKPRELTEGLVMVASRDAFRAVFDLPLPDVRLGDVVRVTLVSAAVPDVTAGFYCECEAEG